MRTQALTLLVLVSLVNSASANDEINRLLADLSFGDTMTADSSSSVSEKSQTDPILAKTLEVEKVVSATKFSNLPAFSELIATEPGLVLPHEPAPTAVLENPVPNVESLADVDVLEVEAASPPKAVFVQPVETKSIGHRHHSQVCSPRVYETGVVCRPRVTPNLPTSTFLQYFRGNPCYSNAWDGYRYDCGSHHAHLHGECDCFKGKNAGCDSCDSRAR
jgi:hypothetical protein